MTDDGCLRVAFRHGCVADWCLHPAKPMKQTFLESLRWRAKRLWRTWLPEK
jgi:hypothetical protein